jgi:DNA (cytosine-5)-methyltransferase 1
MTAYSFVDLFCGAGGFTEGMLQATHPDGHCLRPLAAMDINSTTVDTYEARFASQLGLPVQTLVADIRDQLFQDWLEQVLLPTLGGRELDLVCGGPPCQGFSVFGARNKDDARNDLVLRYLSTIEQLKPKYFVMENVPGLAHMYGGTTVEKLYAAVEAMKSTKYRLCGPIFVNAADYGVPQTRERLLFIGSRHDVPEVSSLAGVPTVRRRITVGEAISDLAFLRPWEETVNYDPEFRASSAYQRDSRRGRNPLLTRGRRNPGILANHQAAKHSPEVLARFSVMSPGHGLESVPRALWDQHLKTAKKWCVKLSYDAPSYTVVTLPDDFVHPVQPRILTVREMARLQSFDDTYVFYGPRATGGGGKGNKLRTVQVPQYSQVGNAVPPLLAKAVGTQLLRFLASP